MRNHANTPNGDRPALPDDAIPADAFIYPDDPLVLDKFRFVLIQPDEPFRPREEEGGVVVGLDGSTKPAVVRPGATRLDTDQVADLLDAVSVDLRKNGIDSLRGNGGTSTVETDLKIHLAKYFSKRH